MRRSNFLFSFSSLLFLLFLYSATAKLYNPLGFEHELAKQPIPIWLQTVLHYGLPRVEILLAIGLVLGQFYPKFEKISFLSSLVLMAIFTIYTILALTGAFGHVPCACGGIIELMNWKQHLVFNLFFLGISIAGYILSKKGKAQSTRGPKDGELALTPAIKYNN
jgi:hypothetical protein